MNDVLFREEQRFPTYWFVSTLIFTLIMLVIIITAILPAMDKNPMALWVMIISAVTCILLSWAVGAVRLITEVRTDGLYVRFKPFRWKHITFDRIKTAEARTYSPMKEYGGWGYRVSSKGKAFNTSGKEGVQLVLEGEMPLLLGSGKHEELARVINQHLT